LADNEPVFTPQEFIQYVAASRNVSVETIQVPRRLLMTYLRDAYDHAKTLIDGKPVGWWFYGDAQPFCVGQFNGAEIGLGRFWIGAPAAIMTLEEVIACGAKVIFEVGVAGGLQSYLQPADIVVVTRAIRDEGTSHQYLRADETVESSARLRDRLVSRLKETGIRHFVGPVWSTDAVYRETRGKFRSFRDAGALAVDMETSAVFALARYRGVEAASVQVISDVLSETGWLQAWRQESVRQQTQALLTAVLQVLSEITC
jgi:uridine phosphorylase